ncbi:MAG: AmiR/NasT family two-component response regulator [Planctomycetaceae bacterium]|jgi:AmiR/NasT family two-component response regulator
MTGALRLIVADDEPDMRDFYQTMLTSQGHDVVAMAEDGRQLVDLTLQLKPDLIITDIRMPELDGLSAVREITSQNPIAAIVVSAYTDDAYIQQATRDCILAYLVKPIRATDLSPAIALARQRFREFQALQQQADSLRQTLEDRKLIERAKGIVMDRGGLSKKDAFLRLRKLSNDRNEKLVDIARTIVTAEAAFETESIAN